MENETMDIKEVANYLKCSISSVRNLVRNKEIKFYRLSNGKEPVKEWLLDLDKSIRVKVIRRIERIYDNNFGGPEGPP